MANSIASSNYNDYPDFCHNVLISKLFSNGNFNTNRIEFGFSTKDLLINFLSCAVVVVGKEGTLAVYCGLDGGMTDL